MTTFLLVRHALCDPVGRALAGRAPGVSLNEAGRAQAARLAARLEGTRLDAIYSSPLERAMETAAAIAGGRGLAVVPVEALTEIEFGEWTGRTIESLAPHEEWRLFNTFRSGTRPPGGEMMLEAQARAVAALVELRARHSDGVVAVVSHGDVIKAVAAYFLGVPLDLSQRMEISPASCTVLRLHSWGAQLLALNVTEDPFTIG